MLDLRYGRRMAEKKRTKGKTKSTVEVQEVKKATTGAWWKSSVASTPPEEKETSPPKPRRGRPRKKSVSDTAAEKSSGPEKPSQDSTAVEPQETGTGDSKIKRARRGRPRKKPSAVQKTGVEGKADETVEEIQTGEVVDAGSDDKPPRKVKKKPARRGRPRKQPERKLEPSEKEGTESSPVTVDGDGGSETPVVAEPDGESAKTPQKPKAKRPRRKRQPKSSSSEQIAENKQRPDYGDAVEELSGEGEPTDEEKKPVPAEDDQKDGAEEVQEGGEVAEKVAAEDVPKETEEKRQRGPKPVIKLLINAEEPEECRLALLEDGRLESIHVATSTRTQTKNNIYKARIVAIEPNLQAAFVDYGTEKNGFLPFSEIHPEYYKENVSDKVQKIIDDQQWKKLSITDVVEKGREVLVQVVKEEVGKKGANMTTYLSLPGRCVVLMPGSDSTGISRKISGEEKRSKLRNHILSMDIPEGIGWIIRTASVDITKAALGRDVSYLLRLWGEVKKKGQDLSGVGLIYQDHDHVLRFLREHFDPDIQEILVDDSNALDQVKDFIELLPAKQQDVKCKLHRGARPIFNQYSVEDQIESIYQPKVNLPSGGSIVIDPTEALVAIDVNSGSTSKGQNFEETIFQANKEAATELARQLRLRDLGGLVVVDFIDMRSKKNIREVERQVKTAMKRDKAKVDVSRISKFGLMQISRQKLGAPIEAGNYRVCGHCKGRGMVRSVETIALYYLRRIHTAASRKMVVQIECRFPIDVAGYLLNNKRHELRELELRYNTEVVITADPTYKPADNEIIFHKKEKEDKDKKRS